MKRSKAKLGNVCRVTPGFAFKSESFQSHGIPVVKIANIRDDYTVDLSEAQCWPTELFSERLQKFVLRDKDIVLAMTGATAGKLGRVRTSCDLLLNQRVAKIEPLTANSDFIWFALSSPKYRELFYSIAGGAAQPNMSGGQIEAVEIPLPKVEAQERIASILSAYDEQMENNRRRMGLLEKAARLLYEEWFIRLRFPGHEHTPITQGIPQGWEKKRLDGVAEVNRASLPGSHDGEIRYVDISAVAPGQITETSTVEFRDAPSRARRIVQHGDIIWSCVRPNRRSHAVIWNPPENLIVSTGFAVITPLSLPTSFLYFATTADAFVGYLENHAKGAAYPAVVAGDFEGASVVVPTKQLLTSFDEMVEPMFSQIHNLRCQNHKLRAARDLLLPRLMSGEIEV